MPKYTVVFAVNKEAPVRHLTIVGSKTVLSMTNKTVTVEVNDTGDEKKNKADALITASLELDALGITEWSLVSCGLEA